MFVDDKLSPITKIYYNPSVYLAMTIGNPTSSEGELVIGECELMQKWINQFNNSVPNSVRIALDVYHTEGSESGHMAENHAALIQR